jgi:phage-related baseplate assembly protein
MRRRVLIALTVLSLAGCSGAQTSYTRLNHTGDQIDPAFLRPDLGEDVTGGIQTRQLDSVRPGR